MTKFLSLVRKTVIGFIIGLFLGGNIFNSRNSREVRHSICQSTKHIKTAIRKLAFIGILTARKYKNREDVILETWLDKNWRAKSSDVRFIREPGTSDDSLVISLPHVSDNVYPPQKKSFMLFLHLYTYMIDKYDWFIRIDDDSYLHMANLEPFLRKLDPNIPLMIGSAGFGRSNEDLVEPNMTYCMGGTGIIFSRRLLFDIGPHLASCATGDIFTEHEDIELGRCIWRRLGISCTNALDARNLFFNNFRHDAKSEIGYYSNIKVLDKRLARHAITLHPNKDPDFQRATHAAILREEMQKCNEKIYKLKVRRLNGESDDYLQSGCQL